MPLTMATPTVLTDPGYLFWAVLASTEPTHAALASSYDADTWPVAWIPLGATEDGSEFSYESKIEAVRVAEFFDPISWRTTERNGGFAFNLASYTLKNLQRAYNGGTIATVSGSGVTLSSSLVPPAPGAEVRCMLGWESLDHTMRLVCYQTINGGAIKNAFRKAPAISVIPCAFNLEVPTSGIPFKWYAAGTPRLGV